MTRRTIRLLVTLTVALGFLIAPVGAGTQPAGKTVRIGYLGDTPGPFIEAFHQGLRELGYVEGENLTIEYRWAEGNYDRLRELAVNLVQLQVEVIITPGTPASRAAKQATTTIPIVMAHVGDPLQTGLVASLAQPGGNITGVSLMNTDTITKQLELLKEAMPSASTVAVLWNSANPASPPALQELQAIAPRLGVRLQTVDVQRFQDFERAFAAITQAGAEMLLVVQDPYVFMHRQRIVALAAEGRLPAIYMYREWVKLGGLMAYGASLHEVYRRVATLMDKILKGAKPGTLPVEQVMRLDLVINLKTAQTLGLTIPPTLLFQATEIIREAER
jgi:putative tryptophan/tyrosine transport system substrate-binding protein